MTDGLTERTRPRAAHRWFAENVLISEPNEPCDLRLVTSGVSSFAVGGYIAASASLRQNHLGSEERGCEDVIYNSLGSLLLGTVSDELNTIRLNQKQRIRLQTGSECDFDGAPLADDAARRLRRRRRLRQRGAPHQPQQEQEQEEKALRAPSSPSHTRRRRLKGSAASSTAAAAVATVEGGGGSSIEGMRLGWHHFEGFFYLMAGFLLFTILTSPRFEWLARRLACKLCHRSVDMVHDIERRSVDMVHDIELEIGAGRCSATAAGSHAGSLRRKMTPSLTKINEMSISGLREEIKRDLKEFASEMAHANDVVASPTRAGCAASSGVASAEVMDALKQLSASVKQMGAEIGEIKKRVNPAGEAASTLETQPANSQRMRRTTSSPSSSAA